MQEYPGHVVGRLGRAVLKLYSKEYSEAVAEVTPMPRQLGTLGLFRGVAAMAESLRKIDTKVEKVPDSSNTLLKSCQRTCDPLINAFPYGGLRTVKVVY